jgi:hypothetical protein
MSDDPEVIEAAYAAAAPPTSGTAAPADPPEGDRARPSGENPPPAAPDDVRAAVAFLQSRFQAEASLYSGLRHVLVAAPNPEALDEAYWLSDRAADRRYYIRRLRVKADGELHIFIDANYARVTEGIDALCSLSRQAVKMLAANGILQPTEPPPDPFDTREAQPHEKFYSLRQWMLFVHRHAKDRPGAPPGVEVAPYLEHFRLTKGGIAYRLECGVFEASAVILGRILAEVSRGARQAATPSPAPPASGNRTPAEPAAGLGGDDRRNTNDIVNEHLQRDENISAADISRATGIPAPTVRNSKAWKTRPKGQTRGRTKSTDAMDHARPLTAPMLAARKSEVADPADIAAEQEGQDDAIEPTELLRRRYLEGATEEQRARFHKLNPADQEHELKAWEVTGDRVAE